MYKIRKKGNLFYNSVNKMLLKSKYAAKKVIKTLRVEGVASLGNQHQVEDEDDEDDDDTQI